LRTHETFAARVGEGMDEAIDEGMGGCACGRPFSAFSAVPTPAQGRPPRAARCPVGRERRYAPWPRFTAW